MTEARLKGTIKGVSRVRIFFLDPQFTTMRMFEKVRPMAPFFSGCICVEFGYHSACRLQFSFKAKWFAHFGVRKRLSPTKSYKIWQEGIFKGNFFPAQYFRWFVWPDWAWLSNMSLHEISHIFSCQFLMNYIELLDLDSSAHFFDTMHWTFPPSLPLSHRHIDIIS